MLARCLKNPNLEPIDGFFLFVVLLRVVDVHTPVELERSTSSGSHFGGVPRTSALVDFFCVHAGVTLVGPFAIVFNFRSYWLRSEEYCFQCTAGGIDKVPKVRSNCFPLELGIPGLPIFRAIECNGFDCLLGCHFFVGSKDKGIKGFKSIYKSSTGRINITRSRYIIFFCCESTGSYITVGMYGPYVLFNNYSQIILCMTLGGGIVDPINHGSFYPACPWPFIDLHENIHLQLPSFLD